MKKMDELRNKENRRRQRFGKLRELFEEIQTMRLMGYSVEDMTNALEDRQTDAIYFANQYIEIHKDKTVEDIVKQAYELLYSEEPPVLKQKKEHKTAVTEVARETMEVICTRRLIRAFIRNRVEQVGDLLSSGRFDTREFASGGYDRHYIEVLTRTVKLFSPTVEISREMLQDKKRMQAIIDRIYEELYVLTKRTRVWTCDWLDFEGLRKYEGGEWNDRKE